jgi:hypothetical protein
MSRIGLGPHLLVCEFWCARPLGGVLDRYRADVAVPVEIERGIFKGSCLGESEESASCIAAYHFDKYGHFTVKPPYPKNAL